MARKTRARYYTPPPELSESQKQAATPNRSAVITAKLIAQEMGIHIPQKVIHKVSKVPPRSQTRILASKQVRTRHNIPDSGPDPRGRKPALTRSNCAAIADYLDSPQTSLEDKSAPWLDIAESSGLDLPETWHFKPPGFRIVNTKTIQRTYRFWEDLINAVCEEEKELTGDQASNRNEWIGEELPKRPHSIDWKDCAFCDEFHFGIGPQTTKHIKRKKGSKHRYKPENVHRKKVTTKDTKAKAREDNHLKLLSVFVVIGYNYRKIIPYKVSNSVGKMTTKVYIEQILPLLLADFQRLGLTLIQDADSAHKSAGTIAWAKKNHLPLLTLPGVSPDFSILETLAHPLKKQFHAKRCTTENAALARFTQIFENEMDQEKIHDLLVDGRRKV
ncbi:hypothetical protein LCER1_G002685 [Lachnellula cervina]|uniref:Tc1-like transposase DDE domain-containing protein n=1 Tax=Lachnellula cervina TaxID=1316786 RepID=A0A7D8V0Z3_9HELO|nr:hypothetical protein LCER1_G002685 [Lachnellula cervina]